MIILATSLLLTALFLAQGTTGLLASFLFSSEDAGPVERGRRGARGEDGASAGATRERRGAEQIISQNIFFPGPMGGTPEPEPTPDGGVPELAILDPDAVLPRCEGSVRLSGAIVSEDRPSWSFAAIIGAAGRAMLYRVGMNVDGRELVAIYQNRIVMTQSGSYCQLGMFMPGEAPAATASNQPTLGAAAAAKAKRPQPAAREGAISAEDMEAGITRVSDTQFTLQRSLVDRVLENQSELMRTARIIPHEQGGRTVGVKLYGIRRNSLLGQLGLQNGDMMRTLNGFDMSSPDSALEAYARLRGADHLTLQVVRRGQPITVDYNIQ